MSIPPDCSFFQIHKTTAEEDLVNKYSHHHQIVLTFDPSAGDARHLRQECHTSQRLRSERDANLTYIMRANHEFYCSSAAPINHKVTADTSPNLIL